MMANNDHYRPSGIDDLVDAQLSGSTRNYVMFLIGVVIAFWTLGFLLR